MRGRWRWDEQALTFVPFTDDRVPYRDMKDAEQEIKKREDEKRERDARPGTYL